jgi:hypothetical protein
MQQRAVYGDKLHFDTGFCILGERLLAPDA